MSSEAIPNVFNTAPPSPKVPKPGHIPQKKVQEFFTKGYTVVDNFFTPEELQPCKNAISRLVDSTAKYLHDAGKITDLHEGADLSTRLTLLQQEFPGVNIVLFRRQRLSQEFIDLWSHPRLLDCVEQQLGGDDVTGVACHPVWNLRTKTPRDPLMDLPWHQDSAYFDKESHDHMIVTAWIPFVDATPENGCMQMVRRGQRSGKVARHTCCAGPSWYVNLDEEDMTRELGVDCATDIDTVPVSFGSVLLFSNLIPHRSLPNVSNGIRWSVDLRWQRTDKPWGYYGLQDGVFVRENGEDLADPDWETYLKVNRKEKWQKRYTAQSGGAPDDPLDLTITGPWIGNWEIVNHNTHTDAFVKVTG